MGRRYQLARYGAVQTLSERLLPATMPGVAVLAARRRGQAPLELSCKWWSSLQDNETDATLTASVLTVPQDDRYVLAARSAMN